VEVPTREVNVKKINLLKIRKINSKILLQNIQKRITKVEGDFRQSEICGIWHKNLNHEEKQYVVAGFKIKCGSGTYVRSIANSLGIKIGVPALAFSIKRTKLGKWRLVE